jgi:predicted O-methyltransferase YrrM
MRLSADVDALRARIESAQVDFDDRVEVARSELSEVSGHRDAARERVTALEDELVALRRAAGFVPPGHFYSPIPDFETFLVDGHGLFGDPPPELPAIDLRVEEQLSTLRELSAALDGVVITEEPGTARYHLDNGMFAYADGTFLAGMLKLVAPRLVVEVGSGFSTAVMLDHGPPDTEIVCVEPYPDRLLGLMGPGDDERVQIIGQPLQEVDLSLFDRLGAGDLLFVDSTHVSKLGSDVNRLVFDIFPRLAPGVIVHVHDIHYPFEYPKRWVAERRAWNEAYLLRAFLEFNETFEIVLFGSYLQAFHTELLERRLPIALRRPSGSIYLRKRS